MLRSKFKLLIRKVMEVAAADIPFGNRGYLIEPDGRVTVIDHMWGHESFVRNYSKKHFSAMELVADKGWVMFDREDSSATMTYCRESVTKPGLATAVRIINSTYKDFRIQIHEYVKEDDQELPVLHDATNRLASQFLIKLKISLQ